MTIKKQYLKNKSQCKVTFRVHKEMGNGAKEMNVVGEFNQWNKSTGTCFYSPYGICENSVIVPFGNEPFI